MFPFLVIVPIKQFTLLHTNTAELEIGILDAVHADVTEICAPKIPGSFILEWVFCIDADQRFLFWMFAIGFFAGLHLLVLVVAKLSALEKCYRWLSFATTNGITALWKA